MTVRQVGTRSRLALLAGAVALSAQGLAHAQVTPAAGYTPPDDTPSFKVGAVIFTDYTATSEPETTDAAGNSVKARGFNVSRAYINLTGNLSSLFSYRVTPDITRETGAGSSLNGSLDYRLKYAYGQLSLDRWATKGSFVRLGMQQTPYVDFADSVYRYRFQGTTFLDREGILSSSDFGLTARYVFPGSYGDVHGGLYNGDGYTKAEANDQQAFQVRATLRPAPLGGVWSGLRVTAFYDADQPVDGGSRDRLVGALTFEHRFVHAGFEWASTTDQALPTSPEVEGEGYSAWVTPRTPFGLEGLLRRDSLKPNKDLEDTKDRTIAGVAYWFRMQPGSSVAAALLLDHERVTYDAGLSRPDEKRLALHALFQF
jgi:hypothetical protein